MRQKRPDDTATTLPQRYTSAGDGDLPPKAQRRTRDKSREKPRHETATADTGVMTRKWRYYQ